MNQSRLGRALLAIGITLLVVAVLLLIFVDTIAIAICFLLSILFNVAGLTLLTMPGNQKRTGGRRR